VPCRLEDEGTLSRAFIKALPVSAAARAFLSDQLKCQGINLGVIRKPLCSVLLLQKSAHAAVACPRLQPGFGEDIP
jgi:hypothetical protein